MNITITELSIACGTVLALYTFYKTLKKDFNSMLDVKLNPLKDNIKLCLSSEVLLMHHLTEGNHDEKIKQLIKDIEKDLISK